MTAPVSAWDAAFCRSSATRVSQLGARRPRPTTAQMCRPLPAGVVATEPFNCPLAPIYLSPSRHWLAYYDRRQVAQGASLDRQVKLLDDHQRRILTPSRVEKPLVHTP